MSYFRTLGLNAEPFSTSPDPAYCFLSREHKAAFFRLQIAVKLRRGMSVLLGDVGTGKTTLSRKLAQTLSADKDVNFHMILNPYFTTEREFLSRLARLYRIRMRAKATTLDHMEAIERFLFEKGVEQGKTMVLLIDEAQILPDFVLETLRILLNYETNEFKILQLVLVGQMELLPRISKRHNFWDRIALKYVLNPLCSEEVGKVIDFRLLQAGYDKNESLFTDEAVRLIWNNTEGYPRKLAILCHDALEHLVMHDEPLVNGDVIRGLIERDVLPIEGIDDDEPTESALSVPDDDIWRVQGKPPVRLSAAVRDLSAGQAETSLTGSTRVAG